MGFILNIFVSDSFKGVGCAEYFASVFQNPTIFVDYHIIFIVLTVGVVMGAHIAYGSYLSPKENVIKNSFIIPVADTVFALLSGFAFYLRTLFVALIASIFLLGVACSHYEYTSRMVFGFKFMDDEIEKERNKFIWIRFFLFCARYELQC